MRLFNPWELIDGNCTSCFDVDCTFLPGFVLCHTGACIPPYGEACPPEPEPVPEPEPEPEPVPEPEPEPEPEPCTIDE